MSNGKTIPLATMRDIQRTKITTWGSALQWCRVERQVNRRYVAHHVGVSEEQVEAWERNEAIPDAQRRKRLFSCMHQLRSFDHLLPREVPGSTPTPIEAPQSPPHVPVAALVAVPPPPATSVVAAPPAPPTTESDARVGKSTHRQAFGRALKAARVAAGLQQRELAELLGVHQSSASAWETGETWPFFEKLKRIVELFPALSAVVMPVIGDLRVGEDKPAPEAITVTEAVPAPAPAPPAGRDIAKLGAAYGQAEAALAEAKKVADAAREALRLADAEVVKRESDVAAALAALREAVK